MTDGGAGSDAVPRYCPGCGMPLPEQAEICPHCGRSLGMAHNFYAQVDPRPPTDTVGDAILGVGRAVGAYTALALIVLLIINAGILIWSLGVVLPIAADPSHGTTLYLLIPGPNPILRLFPVDGVWFGVYHVLIVSAILASLAWTFKKSAKPFAKELTLQLPEEGHSPIYRITTLFLTLMAVNLIYVALIILFNAIPNSPGFEDMKLWQLLHAFASASVWEELITRVLWLGVPLLLIDLALGKARSLKPYLLGGSKVFGTKEIVFIWVSAGIFALGHIVYWDAFKLLPTFAAGIALGFLFIRYGLYACIVLHFAVDYYDMLGLSLNSVAIQGVFGLILIALGILGMPFLVVYARRIIMFVLGLDLRPRPAPTASSLEAGMGGQTSTFGAQPAVGSRGQSFFTCARCGSNEAKYQDGKLECVRCGWRQ